MSEIPLVFACDSNYLAPTYITIFSLLLNKNSKTNYDIYILVPQGINNSIDAFNRLKNEFKNVEIQFIEMGNEFNDLKMKIDHISLPTYYRLCLPDLLLEYDKCIYLDSDIIVKKDLTDLFEIEMDSNYIAGVISEGIQLNKIYSRELCKSIGLPDVKQYINAGVLIMNLKSLRENKITKKWIELSKNNYPAQDQDILNLTCYGKIIVLNLKYNVMTKCNCIKDDNCKKSNTVYSFEEIVEAKKNPVIIHYADKIKPWNKKESIFAFEWWDVVSKVKDDDMISLIQVFLSKNGIVQKQPIIKKMKNYLVRILQLLGIYSFMKKRIYK